MVAPRMLGSGIALLIVARTRRACLGATGSCGANACCWPFLLHSSRSSQSPAPLTLNSPTLAISQHHHGHARGADIGLDARERLAPPPRRSRAGGGRVSADGGFHAGGVHRAHRAGLRGGAAGGLVGGVCTVWAARHLKQRSSLELATVQSLFAGISRPAEPAAAGSLAGHTGQVLVALCLLALVCTALASSALLPPHEAYQPTVSDDGHLPDFAFSLLWGWIFLGDHRPAAGLGFAVVLSAVAGGGGAIAGTSRQPAVGRIAGGRRGVKRAWKDASGGDVRA